MTNATTQYTTPFEEPISDIDELCRQAEPLIKLCIKEHPTFCKEHYQEMYNACIVAILENYPNFDPAKGNLCYFIKFMKGALRKFIAKEIYNFSSLEKYKYYRNIQKVRPNIDSITLKDRDYDAISEMTGYGRLAIDNAIVDSRIAKPKSLDECEMLSYDHATQTTVDPNDIMLLSELEFVMATALKTLTPTEREFVYDMFGFHGRRVMPENSLKKKYSIYGQEYTSYVKEIKRKLLGSRMLRSSL